MQVLQDGGSSQEAVTCAISILEVGRIKIVSLWCEFRIAHVLTAAVDQTSHYMVKLSVTLV